jgi:hypothetical protein
MSMTSNDEQDLSVRDSLLVDNLMNQVASDSRTAYRFRTIVKMNPYMANNPEAVATLASMPISTQEIMAQAGALYGMQVGNGFGNQLKQYDPSTQRSIFNQLTPAQQNSLYAFGYEPPKNDVHGDGLLGEIFSKAGWAAGKLFGGVGKLVGPALSPTLEGLVTIGDYPFKAYRTIRQLDDATQWIALATGLAAAGGVLLAPVTGGASVAVTAALTSARLGLALSAGMAGAAASSLIASSVQTGGTSTWMNAWNAAYNGEKLFTQTGLSRAASLLEDPSLEAIAQDLASESEYPGDLLGIAKQIAGVRGSSDPSVQVKQLKNVAAKYAAPDTPQFTQAYDLLSQLLTLPAFTEAVSILEQSKISMGRDIVRGFGSNPATGWGRWISGSIDGASLFLIDPFLVAGSAARGVAQARRGIQFVDTAFSAERLRQISALPEMQRKLGVVAKAVNAGDIALLSRGAKEYRPIFDQLIFHKRTVGKDLLAADDIVDWLVGTDKLKSIMKGVGVVPGGSYGQLRGLNRGQYAWAQTTGAARDALRGIADVRIENVRLPRIAREIHEADIANIAIETVQSLQQFGLSERAAELVARFTSNLPTRAVLGDSKSTFDEWFEATLDPDAILEYGAARSEAAEFIGQLANNSTLAYQVGRQVGNMPLVGQILTPFANFVEGITTRIPGGAIHLTGLDAPDEIRNFIELFRHIGMPSYARNMWTNAILYSDTAGARLNAISALIDSSATATGMRLTKAGNDLLDEFLEKYRQIYSLGSTGRYGQGFDNAVTQPIGVRPIADMADMVAIPDLKVLRKAVRQGTVLRALIGIPESTHILAFQNKYWKPAVLLRAGFILRNAGEEMLSMLTRYGLGSWSQELVGRKIAQREEYFKALTKSKIKNQVSNLSSYEKYVIRNRYDLPASLRPVARAIERVPDGQPWQRALYDSVNWLVDILGRSTMRRHEFLMNGFGGQIASRMDAITAAASEETAKGRLNTMLSRLAFGNTYSLRRMIIGGIDEVMLDDMRQFEGIYLKAIMDKVGTSNLSPWERLGNRAEAVQRLIIDENSGERIELVNVTGERALSTRSNNLPNQQPFAEANLSRTQELFDDEGVAAALEPVRLLYNADIEASLPADTLLSALKPYAELKLSNARIDDDFLQLFHIVQEGIPRPGRFQAKLRQMRITDDRLEELAGISDALYEWAVNRNALVDLLMDEFPGQRIPSWTEMTEVLRGASLDATDELSLNAARVRDSLEGISGEKADELLGIHLSYYRLKDQFETFDQIANAMQNVDQVGKDWFNNLLIGWRANPDMLNARNIFELTPDMARTKPTFMLYRGMTRDDLLEITDEGDLIFKGTGRDWSEWNPSVSFSLDPGQAAKYIRGQVGGGAEGAETIETLFIINGDELIGAAGKSIDDIIGTEYRSPAEYLRAQTNDDVIIHTVNAPKSPYIHVDYGDAGRRELAVTNLSARGRVISNRDLGYFYSEPPTRFLSELGEVDLLPLFRDRLNAEAFAAELRSSAGPIEEKIIDKLEETAKGVVADARQALAENPPSELDLAIDLPTISINENIDSIVDNVFDVLRRDARGEGQVAYLGEATVQNEVGSSIIDLLAYEANVVLDSDEWVSLLTQMFPGIVVDETTVRLIEEFARVSNNLARISQPGMLSDLEVGAVVRVPKGAWEVETELDAAPGSTLEKLLTHSTIQGGWPFYSSYDEVKDAMKWGGHVELSRPEHAIDLQKNIDWHGLPDTEPAYVVDVRPMAMGVVTNSIPGIDDLIRRSMVRHLNMGYEPNADKFIDAIHGALTEQSPIIVKDKYTADMISDVIKDVERQIGRASRTDAPIVAVTYFPADTSEIRGWRVWGAETGRDSGNALNHRLIGWDGEAESAQNYREFPLVWDWIDSLETPPGPASIIDRMMGHIEQRVRGGRRLQLFVRENPDAPVVYRNVNGEAVQLAPGEMIQAHDQLYSTARMRPKDRINPGDQRFFEQGDITYQGSSEIVWPTLAPVQYDHTESSLGWTLYDLKAPVDVPEISGRRTRIYTDRQRIRYAGRDHVDGTPNGDLPDWEIHQLYRPAKRNMWERTVQFGFSNVIGPTIDALTRKPMAAHAFHIAAERNRNLTRWIIASSPEEVALQNLVVKVGDLTDNQVTPESIAIWSDLGRTVGFAHGDLNATQWSDLQSVAYLRSLTVDERNRAFATLERNLGTPPFVDVNDARNYAAIKYAQQNWDQLHVGQFDNTPDAFLKDIERMFGQGSTEAGRSTLSVSEFELLPDDAKSLYERLSDKDWAVIKKSALQRKAVNKDVYDYAAEHTIRDIMPYVDSHEIRSQFADTASGLLPFWYAEENFLKRWAKIFSEGGPAVSLERVRKLQLTYMGLKNVGIVRTDSSGRDYFVYPGSELLFDAIDFVFPGARLPVEALLQTPTAGMVPGFNRDFGRPSVGPLATIPMDIVTTLIPEAQTFEEAVIGKQYVYNNIVDAVVPRHVSNIWQALGDILDTNLNPNNQRIASAMMSAIAHLEANGQGLPDGASAAQRDDFLRKVRDHARVIVFAQAIGGLFTMGAAQMVQVPEGGSLDWITNGAVTNPAELFSSQYYELIRNLGIELGTQRFLELNENAGIREVLRPLAYTISKTTSPSGAPLPQTDEAFGFYEENRDLLDQYPEAGPWLLPQGDGDPNVRSQYAFDSEIVSGLRRRRTPEEFITMTKYKEGASFYFEQQKVFNDAYETLKLRGQDERAAMLNREWLIWAEAFKATHPLFAEMLVSDDARTRRRNVISQMRYVLKDPLVPKAPHFEKLKILQDSYDAYSVARGELGLDKTARGVSRLNTLKKAFRAWASDFLIENPTLNSYWLTILEPEAGLE